MRAVTLILALVATLALAACGDDEPNEGPADIAELVADPGEPGRDVRIEGIAYPIGEAGFVLAGEEAAVFVDVRPTEAEKIDAGEAISVQGVVERQDGGTAIQIRSQVDGARRSATPVVEDALALAPIGRGEPYVDEASVSGEGG